RIAVRYADLRGRGPRSDHACLLWSWVHLKVSSLDFSCSIERRRARQNRQLGGQRVAVAGDEVDDRPHDARLAQDAVVTETVGLDQPRPRHASGQAKRVLEGHFGVAAVVHEQRRQPQLLQLVDAVDLGKAHSVTVFETAAHRLANPRRNPEQTSETPGAAAGPACQTASECLPATTVSRRASTGCTRRPEYRGGRVNRRSA